MAKKKKKEPLFVTQWCPVCDCERRCEVINRYQIECETCREPCTLAAEVARTQLEGYELPEF